MLAALASLRVGARGEQWLIQCAHSLSLQQPTAFSCAEARRHRSTWSAVDKPAIRPPGLGLFGIAELKQPSDFVRMSRETLARSDEIKDSLLRGPADASVVRLMDEMSDTLCRCYDAAEACRNVHEDPTWRSAASTVCHELGAYISTINHHHGIYKQLTAALAHAGHPRPHGASLQTPHSPPTQPDSQHTVSNSQSETGTAVTVNGWCPETLRVGEQLALDMEKAGIHLPERSRQRMQTLMNANNHYAMSFNNALVNPVQVGSVRVRGSTLALTQSNVGAVMASEHDENIRQQVWRAASRSPASNLTLLEGMCEGRREQAHLLGFNSYSHYKAYGASLAAHPKAIVSFLQRVATDIKHQADQEIQALRHTKAHITSIPPEHMDYCHVAPWDLEFLMGQRKRSHGTLHQSVLQEYTHLPRVLEGLNELMGRSMGVSLHIQPALPQESWAHGVLRCDATHTELGFLGTVYLDLCNRPGKYPSAVTFPIRCGRQLSDGTYQAPVMALLADFGPRYASPDDIRLTARELRILLHEFGHCMHNLCSRTKYQHLAGTRCAQDLVELPSHLFEHFTVDPRSLRVLARHHSTGDPLPSSACEALAHQRRLFSALELQQQVLLSLADQRLFGDQPLPQGGTSMAWAEAVTPYSSLPWVRGSHPEARMSHLTIYGATYYSYVYARCLSAAVWDKLLARDPLCPDAGQRLVQGLLRPGGALEPVALIGSVLGQGALKGDMHKGWAPALTHALLKTAMSTFG